MSESLATVLSLELWWLKLSLSIVWLAGGVTGSNSSLPGVDYFRLKSEWILLCLLLPCGVPNLESMRMVLTVCFHTGGYGCRMIAYTPYHMIYTQIRLRKSD